MRSIPMLSNPTERAISTALSPSWATMAPAQKIQRLLIQGLNAHAQPVDARLPEFTQVFGGQPFGVGFESHLRSRGHAECGADLPKQSSAPDRPSKAKESRLRNTRCRSVPRRRAKAAFPGRSASRISGDEPQRTYGVEVAMDALAPAKREMDVQAPGPKPGVGHASPPRFSARPRRRFAESSPCPPFSSAFYRVSVFPAVCVSG